MLLVFWRGTRAKYLISRRLPAGCDQRCFLLRSKRHVGRSLIDKPRHLLAVTCTGGTILGFLLKKDFATHDLVHPFTAIPAGDTLQFECELLGVKSGVGALIALFPGGPINAAVAAVLALSFIPYLLPEGARPSFWGGSG